MSCAGLAYVAFQELATRISHRNTGRYSSDPVADRIMARIAADENLHMVFYRDMLSEAMKLDPSAAVHAIVDEIMAFQMPGAGMENFTRKAAQMAKAGIYDLRIHHDEVIWPLLRHWGVFEATNLDPSAEQRRPGAEGLPRRPRRPGRALRGAPGTEPRARGRAGGLAAEALTDPESCFSGVGAQRVGGRRGVPWAVRRRTRRSSSQPTTKRRINANMSVANARRVPRCARSEQCGPAELLAAQMLVEERATPSRTRGARSAA